MATGVVKWFNGQKAFVSSNPMTADKTCSCTSRGGTRQHVLAERGSKISYELEKDPRNGKTSAGQLQAPKD